MKCDFRFLLGMTIAAISLLLVSYPGANNYTAIACLVIGAGGGALSLAGHVTNFLDIAPAMAGWSSITMP